MGKARDARDGHLTSADKLARGKRKPQKNGSITTEEQGKERKKEELCVGEEQKRAHAIRTVERYMEPKRLPSRTKGKSTFASAGDWCTGITFPMNKEKNIKKRMIRHT